MEEQYWVGEFFVDLTRNQITQNKQPQTLAPKALAVLTCLAENQGKVVSQETLLTKVWQDTVVSNNTLQRCIAQLRKALGDDGKVQIYIKTHAKKGYSLECNVQWQRIDNSANVVITKVADANEQITETTNSSDVIDSATKSIKPEGTPANSNTITPWQEKYKPAFIITAIFVIVFLGVQFFTSTPKTKLSVTQIRAVTATDGKELASIYSPDNQYFIFHRFSEDKCVSNIWAKNLETQQEHQLTKHLDSYGAHSFSKDGKQLTFIRKLNCEQPITQKKCYQLMSLDFNQALKSPQTMRVLLECKNSEIRTPRWLNNNKIALLQKQSEQWQLISYSPIENTSQLLHTINNGNIIYYDYSVTDDLIALISIHEDNQYYIEILKTNGELISQNPIKFPNGVARYRYLYAKFSPIDSHLTFSTGRQLFTLSYDGKVTDISLPLDEPMGTPVFNSAGDKALAIKGHFDSDVVSIPFTALKQTTPLELTKVLERSIQMDGDANIQPNGNKIAFKSKRSGEQQVWITEGQGAKQLSRFAMDTYIQGLRWAKDGSGLLVNASDALIQVNLDSTQKVFPLANPVFQLLQWDSKNNLALLLIRTKGVIRLAEFNLDSFKINILNNKPVNWAQKNEHNQLIYSDHMDRFWLRGPVEDQHITALDGQGGDNQRFLIRHNVIYGINNDKKLWSYNLETNAFDIIAQLQSNLDYISDIDESQLLMTVRVTSEKEVIELSLKK